LAYGIDDLELAIRRVESGEEHVQRQRVLIARLGTKGHSTVLAQQVLKRTEETLDTLRDHLASIREQIPPRAPRRRG
jgi:hypothetical protein